MKSDSHFGTALAKYNGSIQYLDTYVGMSVEDIDKAIAEFDLKAQNLVPFAKDIDGGLLLRQCKHEVTGNNALTPMWFIELRSSN